MEQKKRKRDTDCAVVTFHTEGKTWSRIFRDQSLSDMHIAVRKKLALPAETRVGLLQVRDGKTIDLEDDDDFEAFAALAQSSSTLDVAVAVGDIGFPSHSIMRPRIESDVTATRPRKRKYAMPRNESFLHESTPAVSGGRSRLAGGSRSESVFWDGMITTENSVRGTLVTPSLPLSERPQRNKRTKLKNIAEPSNISRSVSITPARLFHEQPQSTPDLHVEPFVTQPKESAEQLNSSLPASTSTAVQTSLPPVSSHYLMQMQITRPSPEVSDTRSKKRKRKLAVSIPSAEDDPSNLESPVPPPLAPPESPISSPPKKKSKKKAAQSDEAGKADVIDDGAPVEGDSSRTEAKKTRKSKKAAAYVNKLLATSSAPTDVSIPTDESSQSRKKAKLKKLSLLESGLDTGDAPEQSTTNDLVSKSKRKMKSNTTDESNTNSTVVQAQTAPSPLLSAYKSRMLREKERKSSSSDVPSTTSLSAPAPEVSSLSEENVTAVPKHVKAKRKKAVDSVPDPLVPHHDTAPPKLKKNSGKNKTAEAVESESLQSTTLAADGNQDLSTAVEYFDSSARDISDSVNHAASTAASGPSVIIDPSVSQSADTSSTGVTKGKKRASKKNKASVVAPAAETASVGGDAAHPSSAEHDVAQPYDTTINKTKKRRRSEVTAVDGSSTGLSSKGKTHTMSAGELLAAAQAAAIAVMARNNSSTSGNTPATQVEGDSKLVKKRKAGKSNLSQTWIPDDSANTTFEPLLSFSRQHNSATPQKDSPASNKSGKSGTKKPGQTPQCPVCHETFHLRFKCPVVLAGADSIQQRITELRVEGQDKKLIEEMEALLNKARAKEGKNSEQLYVVNVGSSSSVTAPVETTSPNTTVELPPVSSSPLAHTTRATPSPAVLNSPVPTIPAGSEISEVVVQGNDEGSSNDDSSSTEAETDDEPAPIVSNDVLPMSGLPSIRDIKETDLDALIRGPVKGNVLAQIPSDSSDDEEEVVLEEDDDKEFRRLTRMVERNEGQSVSSDEEPNAAPPTDVQVTFMDVDPNEETEQQTIGVPEVISVLGESSSMLDAQTTANDIPQPSVPMDVDLTPPIEDNLGISIIPIGTDNNSAVDKSREANNSLIDRNGPDTASKSTPLGSADITMLDCETTSAGMIDRELSNSHADSSPSGLENHSGDVPESHPVEEIQPEATSVLQTRPEPESSPVPQSVQSNEDNVTSAQPIHEDPADPIEPAEDPVPIAPEDPIEEDLAHLQAAQNGRASPRATDPQLSMVQRMRNRHGKLPSKDTAPILASQLENTSQTVEGGSEGKTARKTRSASQKAIAATEAMPPPPDTPLTTKRRGRPPVPAEEKARRQAEKDAEKAAKATVKQAEREEKARLRAEKAAEKAAQAAAKAAAKTGKKGKNGSSTPSTSATPAPALASSASVYSAVAPLSVSDRDAQLNTPRGNHEELSTQQSVAKWTTLTQTPSVVDADMTMLDELRSSSPVHSLGPATSIVDELRSESGKLRQGSDTGVNHAHDEADQGASSQPASDLSQIPLFLPGTQTQAVSPRRIPRSSPTRSAASSGSESEDFKLPARPRTWGASARFRRLSEIATQELFTPLPLTPPPQRNPVLSTNMKDMYGIDDDEDEEEEDGDEDEEESGSDDAANRSHIPQGRRAGAGVPKKRSGLL